jgi:hypothetical protein
LQELGKKADQAKEKREEFEKEDRIKMKKLMRQSLQRT